MTVIRGDAARSLMARTQPRQRQQRHTYGVSSWSQSIDVAGPEQAGAALGRGGAILRQRLSGTSLSRRLDDVVSVMTELVEDALAASGKTILRLSWTSSDGVLVEVSRAAPAGAALEAAAVIRQRHAASGTAMAAVDRLADGRGVRPEAAGTCVWARLTSRSTW